MKHLSSRFRASGSPAGRAVSHIPVGVAIARFHRLRPFVFHIGAGGSIRRYAQKRRVIAKAEVTGGEAIPALLSPRSSVARPARDISTRRPTARVATWKTASRSASSTSTATMQANQLRLWFAAMAYVLLCALRRIGLAQSQFADATCGTIRLKLLKLGALVRVSVWRIKIAMASACPWQDEFALAHARRHRLIRTR
jgi:hypothetical protein